MDKSGHDEALIAALKPFTVESRSRSWWLVISTVTLVVASMVLAAVVRPWPIQLAVSLLSGLLLVRGFILYHDFMHGSMLRGSRVARWIMNVYGMLVLTPPRVWRQTHNYHHANTAKIVGSHVGSYPVMTVEMWENASSTERFLYRLSRHPLTILFGYFGIFLFGMCIHGFLRRPAKNWDSALAFVFHVGALVGLTLAFGFWTMFFGFFLPIFVACAVGGYLFYAQHNFEEMHLQPREKWSYARAALESSSYMEMGPVMRWFTGNIGFHHVHHLNPGIPFYRLPEAMEKVPALQNARRTSWHPRDVAACFSLKLWDPKSNRMVGFP